MARPNKTGLDYFPFDVDFFADEKIAAISGEFGIKGEITVIKLLCAVYRNGYFILWNEPLKYKLLRDLPSVSVELFDQIVTRLIRWGFFDKGLFDSVRVLTSRGIQRRFFKIARRRSTAEKLPYLLVSVDNNRVFVDNNPPAPELLSTKTPQRKENKITTPLNTNVFIPPSLEEVAAYFEGKGYTREAAERAYAYYTERNWVDRNGRPVKNWKSKCIAVWFKPENKKPDAGGASDVANFRQWIPL